MALACAGGRYGATHGLDLPFAFGTRRRWNSSCTRARPAARRRVPRVGARVRGLFPTPAAAALSRRMVAAWTGFAATGDPGWPQISADGVPVQVWGSRDRLERARDPREDLFADVEFRPYDGAVTLV